MIRWDLVIKVWPGQFTNAGGSIVRQGGNKCLKVRHVGMVNGHTVFDTHGVIMRMEPSPKNCKRNIVHVELEKEVELNPQRLSAGNIMSRVTH